MSERTICEPCAWGEHADDGTGEPCPCCGADCPPVSDVPDPAPDLPRFLALPIPTTDQNGYAQ